jgi:hypothetical protein
MINHVGNVAFIYKLELKNYNEALHDEHWILSMQEELDQFGRNHI